MKVSQSFRATLSATLLALLMDLLTDANVSLNGWYLESADSISDDGQVIVGNAWRIVGNQYVQRGYIVDFRVVPEPSSAALLFSSWLTIFLFRRPRKVAFLARVQ